MGGYLVIELSFCLIIWHIHWLYINVSSIKANKTHTQCILIISMFHMKNAQPFKLVCCNSIVLIYLHLYLFILRLRLRRELYTYDMYLDVMSIFRVGKMKNSSSISMLLSCSSFNMWNVLETSCFNASTIVINKTA